MPDRIRCTAAFTSVLMILTAWAAQAQEPAYRYRNPIVFQRAHLDTGTGAQVIAGKLWQMEEDGTYLRQLTFGDGYDEHPSFYSDQEHVLYAEFPTNRLDHHFEGRLVKINIYSGEKEVMLHAPGCALHHATISPIDDLLAYHRDCGNRRAMWVGTPEDGYEVTMQATNGVALPDSIIFMHEKNRGIKPREVGLVRMWGHGPGSKAQYLTDTKHLHRRPAISPDGKRLAWQSAAAGEDEIFIANIDGSDARNLTKAKGNDGHPWFSRDSKWIVFESDRSGQWEIWRINIASGKQEQLTRGGQQYVSTRARM